MNIEEVQNVVSEIRTLREMVDEFYELSTRSKVESDCYLQIDNQINKIQGMTMSLALTGKEN